MSLRRLVTYPESSVGRSRTRAYTYIVCTSDAHSTPTNLFLPFPLFSLTTHYRIPCFVSFSIVGALAPWHTSLRPATGDGIRPTLRRPSQIYRFHINNFPSKFLRVRTYVYIYIYINHIPAERVVGVHFFCRDLFFHPRHTHTHSHTNVFSWIS
jgi:hypothetical protein